MMQILTSDDPATCSADLVAENVERLKELFPEAFTEGKIDFEVLKQLLGGAVDEREEKYGLNWHGKRRARQLALTPSAGTLRPVPEESVAWDTTQNLMIEGDNLEVLKLLQKSYAGRVRMIYIDPPYNTGKDFVYPDNYQDNVRNYLALTGQVAGERRVSSNTEFSGRFHTDWMNMIYPRLILARYLLRPDGVLFISIDDGEVANLRKVADEIFGEENFIANVVWQKKYTRANDARWFSDNHDHILVYGRTKEAVRLNGQARNEGQIKAYSNPDNHPKGPWKATPLHAKSGRNTKPYTFRNGVVWAPPKGTFRRFNDDSMRQMDEGDELWFGEDGRQVPQRKSFLSEVKEGVTPVTLWPYQEAGHNHEANNDVKALGLGGIFDNPKPVRLIDMMIQLTTDNVGEHIILDFFAGSGTTAHAVALANAKDNGKRRFVCVQLPEPLAKPVRLDTGHLSTIFDITVERVRRAAKAIQQKYPGYAGDLDFRVYRLSTSNIRAWNPLPSDLERSLFESVDHLVTGRSETDLLHELLLKLGLDLCVPVACRRIAGLDVHAVGGGVLIACLASPITREEVEPLAQGIIQWYQELAPVGEVTCVFRDSAFVDDVTKSNLAAILEQHGIENVRSI